LKELLSSARVFEVDHPITQERKKLRVRQVIGDPPDNLTYIPVDFRKDAFGEKLLDAGYRRDQFTFFIWEGVTMYLPADAVRATLKWISENSPTGSRIVFDYTYEMAIRMLAVADSVSLPPQAKQAIERMRRMTAGEPWIFGVPDRKEEEFLSELGFTVRKVLGMSSIEAVETYLTRADGSIVGKMPGNDQQGYLILEAAVAEKERDTRLISDKFPRASAYHPEWVLASASGGANVLWLAEWLAPELNLMPGMRVLDLGCGRAASSIFLRREFSAQVWAVDLWFSAAENIQRIRDARVEDGVFPLHADARELPFAPEFFDAIVCLDSFYYFGTDDLYLNYLAQFVKPGGVIGIAGAGLVHEMEFPVPEHLREFWSQDLWALHSADWLRHHLERTGILQIEVAETMPDGWKLWLEWQRAVAPENHTEIRTLEEDAGRYLGYVRCIGRRKAGVKLEPYCWPDTLRSARAQYKKTPLLR
jgi:cyclopropane fatty-acyl-phospholipid synthase-like methyltransferase